jgi:hypothetical protein
MSTPLPSDRAAYRAAVAQVAALASAKLPDSLGRIASAVKLVLAGDVELLPSGGAMVASRSKASAEYHLVNGVCECAAYPRAPGNLCAHRLAYGIARRAAELTPALPPPVAVEAMDSGPQDAPVAQIEAAVAAPVAPAVLPEAPASVNCHIMVEGRQVQITLRDTDEGRLLERLVAVLRQYPDFPSRMDKKGIKSSGETSEKGWCAQHHCAMKQTTKDGRSWWSHRTADVWCKGR